MSVHETRSLERNSRLSVAMVKNRAEQNSLSVELGHLEKEKRTVLRMLQKDKQYFKLKYSKSSIYADSSNSLNSDETLSKYFVPSVNINEDFMTSIGDNSKISAADFEEIHNMLFTNDEIDKEKIVCLHLLSAHRSESLTPPKRKLAHMCKIHSPLERLLERSKRKNIHLELKMASMLPIYTVEITEFGPQAENNKDLINDGRLATRILMNERVRELVNTVLNALKQSNPAKNYEIFEMANDTSCLKQLFTKRKILNFLDDLMNCPLINSCESYILSAPFRVKSVQLEIRTISGTLETLVKQIRQNVLQLPSRAELKSEENAVEEDANDFFQKRSVMSRRTLHEQILSRSLTSEGATQKNLEGLYSERHSKRMSDSEKKSGRRVDTNFVQKNINAAANAKKIEYDTDEDNDYYHRPRRPSQSSSSRSRRSSEQSNIIDRPHIQPIKIPEQVTAIMEEKEVGEDKKEDPKESAKSAQSDNDGDKAANSDDSRNNRRRSSIPENENIKIHLKQTTCPACMERYKIPLPPPKTPRVKPSSVIPLAPGENPDLKTNSKNRISMLINKEMFKLQSYERRFSSEDNSRRSSLKKRELETCSSSYMNLSPLELAKIEQEIKEKETQKKLEKFLRE